MKNQDHILDTKTLNFQRSILKCNFANDFGFLVNTTPKTQQVFLTFPNGYKGLNFGKDPNHFLDTKIKS